MEKIALGGGCHWCTEAVFQLVKGVRQVEQGYVSSFGNYATPSEAVMVHFDPSVTSLYILIKIHLHTHSSSSNHKMRGKYRSAIYTFSEGQAREAVDILLFLQKNFPKKIITLVLAFKNFLPSPENFQKYYESDPERPFCATFIEPKLEFLRKKFPEDLNNGV